MKNKRSYSYWLKYILGASLLIGFAIGYLVTPYHVQVPLLSIHVQYKGEVINGERDSVSKSIASNIRHVVMEAEQLSPKSVLFLRQTYGELNYEKDSDSYFLSCWGMRKGKLISDANQMAHRICERIKKLQIHSYQAMQEEDQSRLEMISLSFQTAKAKLIGFQEELGIQSLNAELESSTENQKSIQRQIEGVEVELHSKQLQITNYLQEIVRHHPTILSLRRSLNEALLHYTEAHPKVQELRSSLTLLESRIREQDVQMDADILSQGNSLAQDLYTEVVKLRSECVVLKGKLKNLEIIQEEVDAKVMQLLNQQPLFSEVQARVKALQTEREYIIQNMERREFELANPSNLVRILEAAKVGNVQSGQKWINGFLGALGLMLLSGGITFWNLNRRKSANHTICTAVELARVSGLPILASLDHTQGMPASQLENWAFDTFTTLKGKLNKPLSNTLVCGFLSSQHGEGRSTWVKALGHAARKKGLRVLTINAGSPPNGCSIMRPSNISNVTDITASKNIGLISRIDETLANGTEGASLDVQSLQWAWDLESRHQWKNAMEKCQAMDNAVVLIELPPVSKRESVMLAEHIPNIVWLCAQGQTTETQIKSEIDMLRCAQVHLAGAVMNCPKP